MPPYAPLTPSLAAGSPSPQPSVQPAVQSSVPPVAQPLAELRPGSRVQVVRVLPAGGAEIARRLEDLGFTPGAVVDVVRCAPLRDPVEYRVKDYDICLRRAQAALIEVCTPGAGTAG